MNRWEVMFPVIAQTKDYGGQGRPLAGDTRNPVSWSAEHLMPATKSLLPERERFLRRAIYIWRQLAEQGKLPHPGMIPEGVRHLQGVPGWEEAEYPHSDVYLAMLLECPYDPVMPPREETHQLDRRPIPESNGHVHDYDINTRLTMAAANIQLLLFHSDWTDKDIQYWHNTLEPLVEQLIAHIPALTDA
jgi:hypothetical protein